MNREQMLTTRGSNASHSSLPHGDSADVLATQETSASSSTWTHSELHSAVRGPDSGEVSLRDLRDRVDRARAESYVESCKHRALVPQTRALIREARTISATLQLGRMRQGILVAEIKRNFAMGHEIYEASMGPGRQAEKPYGTSVQ